MFARRAAEREATPRLAKKSKARATTALIKLNSMLGKRLVLKGIISEDGVIASGGVAEILLSNFWTLAFTSVKEGKASELKGIWKNGHGR